MHTQLFHITGLPRSRTAWLANMLSFGPSYCYHEALSHVNSMDELTDLMMARGFPFVGNCDSGIPMFSDEYLAEYAHHPLVIIDRPIDDAIRSCNKAFNGDYGDMIHRLQARLNFIRERKVNVLSIPYRALDNVNTMEVIWDHCVPGFMFDKVRFTQLAHFNVSVHVPKYLNHFENRAAQMIKQRAKEFF